METNQTQSSQTYSPKPAPSPQIISSQEPKRKVSRANIVVFIILLIILGIVALFFLLDSSKIGECETKSECGIYNVFYINGQGYVCANKNMAQSSSLKLKVLMFKYANKKAIESEPKDCLCSSNQCEVDLD